MTPRFVHLHVHSEYSLRDSTARLPEKPEYGDPKKAPRPNVVSRAVELAQPALALTDLSNFFGLVKFYRAAEKAGIKPIAGADVLLESGNDIARLTLLCQNRSGYLGLSRLLSRAYLEGHHGDHVAIRPEWLHEETDGLIVIAGRESPFGKLAVEGHVESAENALRELERYFPERVYLELVRTGRRHEEEFNAAAIDLAARRGLPLLASNDVRFLDREDFEAHEARVCIASGWVLNDPRRPHDYSAEQYLKSEDEMCALFADLPEALANSVELAKRCNLELEFGRNYLPAFPVPAEHTLDSWMRRQAHDGLNARLVKQPPAEGFALADYERRLDAELSVIIQMDFAGYFLIVADFINWAKQHAIPVGPGRGSGAGSLVAYALGITDLDPIRYDLLFERFLNPERVSMPDFDIDFCMVRRDEVIDYVAQKYGRDHVSQIITYGTMAAKAVVRDAGRVLGMPHGQVDRIAKMIPLRPADPLSLDDALGRSDRAREDSGRIVAEFKEAYETDDEIRDLVDLAVKLEDLTRNAGKHAGGVVIAPSPLTDFAALFAEQGSRGAVTQFDKDDIEAVGLVKFDFLGLRTLTIIDWAIKAIGPRSAGTRECRDRQDADSGQADGHLLDIMALPLDDAKTYELLSRGETTAVFQFESRGMRDYIRKLKPERFDDLVALAALYRPGPLNSGMVDDFIERRHGRAEVSYPHELLEPILKPTYGVIVYQEQVMQIAQVMAGYSLGGADLLRRAMGKKKPEEMAKERVKFESGAAANGIAPRLATQIFDLMEKFAEYGFNKSHSAAYALIAYQTAWLKAHYPAEFMAATLSADMDSTDKIVSFLQDVRAIGLSVLPPDVNASAYRFIALPERRIRYGLGAVKGVGEGACEAIVRERERGGAYTDLLDFCERTSGARMNRRTIEALINAGALDALGRNRPSLLLQLPEVLKATEQLARERESGQSSLFGGGATPTTRIALPDADNWPLEQQLAGEYATLGHYLSGHPLDPHRNELAALTGCTLADLDRVWRERRDRRGEAQVVLAGIVGLMRRRGDAQAFAQFEDGYGQIEVSFWGETFSQSAPMLTRGRILLIEGGLREDEYTGGFSLRAKQCWDFQQLCAQQARRLSLVADLRERGTLEKIEDLLAQFRPGGTPLRLSLRMDSSRGTLDLNGSQSVRADPQLLGRLRAMPGVSEVALQLNRPWGESR
jgi:DNA polymerase-3 subunit alpha